MLTVWGRDCLICATKLGWQMIKPDKHDMKISLIIEFAWLDRHSEIIWLFNAWIFIAYNYLFSVIKPYISCFWLLQNKLSKCSFNLITSRVKIKFSAFFCLRLKIWIMCSQCIKKIFNSKTCFRLGLGSNDILHGSYSVFLLTASYEMFRY